MENSTKIRKVSRVLQYASLIAVLFTIGLQLLLFFILWRNPEAFAPVISAQGTTTALDPSKPWTSIPAWLINLMPSLMLSYGIWRLSCMFRLFSLGAYFSDESANHLLVFSLLGFMAQFLGPVFSGLAGLVAQIGNEHGEVSVQLNLDSFEIVQLIAWATFMTVAWILREGTRLAKENAEFI